MARDPRGFPQRLPSDERPNCRRASVQETRRHRPPSESERRLAAPHAGPVSINAIHTF